MAIRTSFVQNPWRASGLRMPQFAFFFFFVGGVTRIHTSSKPTNTHTPPRGPTYDVCLLANLMGMRFLRNRVAFKRRRTFSGFAAGFAAGFFWMRRTFAGFGWTGMAARSSGRVQSS